ncbi:anthranilate synthase component I family protein [Psychrobacter sp. 1Y11]|uniref:anthranilate synthase component I family protein n=1 Tax=Psychrobacter sp. 1Y11 TaxID=3457446 RepID=UPI003FD6119D
MSTQHPTTNETPAMPNRSWRFGDLSAAELLPVLQQQLLARNSAANWQLVWLDNDGQPVIGLLPKVSWQLYSIPDSPESYKLIQTFRNDSRATTAENITYEAWQQQLITYCQGYQKLEKAAQTTLSSPHYHHGLIGFIGYDIAAQYLSPAVTRTSAESPLAALGHYDIYLSANENTEAEGIIWSLSCKSTDNSGNAIEDNDLDQLVSYLDALEYNLVQDRKDDTLSDPKAVSQLTPLLAPLKLQPQWQKSDYQQAFAQTQRYLQQGDCYQINLTQAWQGKLTALTNPKDKTSVTLNLIDYLPSLQRNTQAPFAGYMSINAANSSALKNADFELLSCSPELFFTFSKDSNSDKHTITTKPIKGTMPRGVTMEEDATFEQQLINSDKDRSENVMIVDLLRNDLGKYAKTGSVKVPQLFTIESFSNVHHLVSTITAELKANTHPLAVLFGSLPAGSITGTPKKRAVEVISELEIAPRGAYCGTLGYMNFDGSGQWNVLIRTLQATSSKDGHKQVSLWAGGGITVASEVDAEYQECLDKVGNLLTILAQADC